MVHDLSKNPSLISQYVAELRDKDIQKDRLRFRQNLYRIGELAGYEVSKKLHYQRTQVTTPLGQADAQQLAQPPVLATILRAGLPMYEGLLRVFDRADNAFIAAYRKHRDDGSFSIALQYLSCPNLKGRTLLLADPMIATGRSMVETLQVLFKESRPQKVHIICAIAAEAGVTHVTEKLPEAEVWCGAIDPELNDKAYIVPGLGDAGDLAFGEKLQD